VLQSAPEHAIFVQTIEKIYGERAQTPPSVGGGTRPPRRLLRLDPHPPYTHPFNGPLSRTNQVSRYQNKGTRSSAIAEGLRDASCQLKSCQLPRNSAETTCTTIPDQIDGMKLEV